mmetsp:Transcript_26989/g.50401  ORF Transcript_26989/g.50401 Transcript_26989/m.50401 type:complete len:267 (-) Transcript_26989:68-868(-)
MEVEGENKENINEDIKQDIKQQPQNEQVLKKPQRASTPYFLFLDEYRQKVQAEEGMSVHKKLSQIWNNLPPEEKKQYVDRAEVDKERFRKEKEEYEKAGGTTTQKRKREGPTTELSAPKIRRIMQLDPETKSCSKEGLNLICKSTENFVGLLASRAQGVAKSAGRKIIKKEDFYNAILQYSELAFLQVPMPADAYSSKKFPALKLTIRTPGASESQAKKQADEVSESGAESVASGLPLPPPLPNSPGLPMPPPLPSSAEDTDKGET